MRRVFVPQSKLTNDDVIRIHKDLMGNLSSLYFNDNPTLDHQVLTIIKNIFIILKEIEKMEVDFESLFKIIVSYNKDKIWPDGQYHYNDVGDIILPNEMIYPYEEIRNELKKTNYSVKSANLIQYYYEVLNVYNNSKLERSSEPQKLDRVAFGNFLTKSNDLSDDLLNRNDLIDEVSCLGDLLYLSISTLIEMGIDLEKYLEKIVIEDNKSKKR